MGRQGSRPKPNSCATEKGFYLNKQTNIMQNLRLVTVDVIGTIIRFSKPPVQQYVDTAAMHGLQLEYKQLERPFFKEWSRMNKEFPHFGSTTNISSMTWWVTLVKGTFKDALGEKYDEEKVSKIASELYSHYHSPKPYQVLDDGLFSLQKIKEMGLEIGVISNFDNRLHDIIHSTGLSKFVNFVITAEDAKSSKPEPEIFDFALERSGLKDVEPREVLHVGDDMDKDYHGARGVGWNSVLVDRWGVGYTLVQEEHVVQNISDIFSMKEF